MGENRFFVFFDALGFFPLGFGKQVYRSFEWQCAELSGIFASSVYDFSVL